MMRLRAFLLPMVLLISSHDGWTDDIDIYLEGAGAGRPWVHILMDLRAADKGGGLCTYAVDCMPPFMSERAYLYLGSTHTAGEAVSAADILRAVLVSLVEQPRFDRIRLSLMMSNHPGNQPTGEAAGQGGGSILAGYHPLGDHRKQFLEVLDSMPLGAVPLDHLLQPRESFYEWFRYISGGEVALGTNTSGNFGQPQPSPSYDAAIISQGRYVSPFTDTEACPRLYGILASLGAVGADSDLDDAIASSLAIAPDSGFGDMLGRMQHPETDLLPQLTASVPLRRTLVIGTRAQEEATRALLPTSGGHELAYIDDPRLLEQALTDFLDQAMAGSGSLVAASAAVDVFQPGAILDRFYIGLFKPEGGAAWDGNLKKFRLLRPVQQDERLDPVQVVDVLGLPAFATEGEQRGMIAFDALSFWTDVATLPPGDGISIPLLADGREVTRGGAGQKIDGFVDYLASGELQVGDDNGGDPAAGTRTRQVFVEPPVPGEFLPFNADPETIRLLGDLLDPRGNYSQEERLELVRWGRGQDTVGATRRWLLGDVLHSRPLSVNYGATPGYSRDNPLIRVFFGSGDGLFHMLEDTDPQGRESGRERFAFYPREALADIALLRDNALPAVQRPYGVDGEPVALRVDRDRDGTIEPLEGDEVYNYFALDASDPGASPRLAWKLAPGGDFSELGLSFSTPLVGRVKFEESPRDVVIFGGGYHGGWNATGTARVGKDLAADDDPVGNAIYIVDARTGELVWKAVQGSTGSNSNRHYEHADLVDSIPSAVTALRSAEGLVHRLYVGDTGGAVWRIDLPPGESEEHRRDSWFISKLADLGLDAGEPDGSDVLDLRFFHPPEVVRSHDEAGAFDGLLIQSGDRAHPKRLATEDYLFYLKDREVRSGADLLRPDIGGISPSGSIGFEDLPDQTDCVRGTERDPQGMACRDRSLAIGWKLRFERQGEKGLSRPLVDAGRVFATTYSPGSESACAPREGQGHLYVVRLADATALVGGVRVRDLGPGIPADPVYAGDHIMLPGRGARLYDRDGDGVADVEKLLPSQAPRRYRIDWREPGLDPL
jgi:type IV pilus assembly protein PilY1